MVQRESERFLRRGRRSRLDIPARRGREVRDRFGHTPEHEDRADPGGEEHGEPCGRGVFRPLVVTAESHVPEPADTDPDEKNEEDRDTGDVEPPQVGHDPIRRGIENGIDPVPEEKCGRHERDDRGDGNEEYCRVRFQPQFIRKLFEHERPRSQHPGTPTGRVVVCRSSAPTRAAKPLPGWGENTSLPAGMSAGASTQDRQCKRP